MTKPRPRMTTTPPAAARERMSRVDTAWLRMERPTNLMMITGVLMFAAPLDPKRIKSLLSERFLAYRRFPDDIFVGAPERIAPLRAALSARSQ